ncbi:uracil-DNA glycosylase [Methylovirgula ligni]|uniref:Type-4 uracil-DNA glycosylase n=1 Tax=Methylovirgula ligni TaxID=569860 RepID=A0A3D9YXE3_9HYPH|nr:uracil-DNA glycosylase [Methylovirgula ligni]QAY95962.1 uracil-DNA glycosylase [Methylovirgula ligni]REF86371.1 DNA polymerase [Methylovirgula ligni]
MPDEASPAALTRLLRWYADMGVDLAVDDMPHDRFAESQNLERPPSVQPAPMPAPMPRRPATVPARVPMSAPPLSPPFAGVAEAVKAQTLEDLRAELLAFEGCGLKATATQLVFADGNPEADIMFVGEAPGADEDRIGRPFVGRAGQLLDKMLAAIGLDRTKVYIANVVPWRPPGNRTPTPLETGVCLPFTRRQIELVAPKILICLGAPSMQTLLGIKEGIMRSRGRWVDYDRGGTIIPAMAMLHPAYLLRQPSHKKFAWQDLRELAKKIDKI